MPISSLRINNFRNIAALDIAFSTGINIIAGNNGSGKTSLLEAIYCLGLGRSFRSSTTTRLIRHQTEKFSLYAHFLTAENHTIPIGMERKFNHDMRLRISDKDTNSIAELASFMPVLIINSQSHQLFESGPAVRRKYLDWGLFYQSRQFLHCWQHYERILKQRNSVLHDQRPKKELDIWTHELVKYGLEFDQFRREYIALLTPAITQMAAELLDIHDLEVNYLCGWDESITYAEVLAENYRDEYRLGHTQFGPHRADLELKMNGLAVKHFLSRGQQKLLICAMIIAQGIVLAQQANKGLIYLIDDLPSELDLASKQKLISLLSCQQAQIFITAIEAKTIADFIHQSIAIERKVFHVEHGHCEVQL